MSHVNRRDFLEGSLALTGAAVWSQVAGGAPDEGRRLAKQMLRALPQAS